MAAINQKSKWLMLLCSMLIVSLWFFWLDGRISEAERESSRVEESAEQTEEQLLVTTPVVTTELTIVTDEVELTSQTQQETNLSQDLSEAEEILAGEETMDIVEIDPQEQVSLLKVDINYMIEQWQEAWQTGDTIRYLSFYSHQFTPAAGRSLSQWRRQRQTRVTPDKPVTLSLSNFDVVLEDDNQRAIVSFDQFYKSSTLQEQSRKQLELVKSEAWLIVTEKELKEDN